MTMVSFGDLAQSFLLRHNMARLKADVARSSQEVASGRVHDIGAAVHGDHSKLTSISYARKMTEGYKSAASDAAFKNDAVQNVIEALNSSSQDLVAQLLSAPMAGESNQIALTAEDATSRFSAALSSLNTSISGQSLFAGTKTNGDAVGNAETILAALRQEIAGVSNTDEALAKVKAWFDTPDGFESTAYLGGEPHQSIQVSATDRLWAGPTANDPAFRAVLSGLAMASLLTDQNLTMTSAARAELAQKTGEYLTDGQNKLIHLGARVGVVEARTSKAQADNMSSLLQYELEQSDIVSSDKYRSAIELEAAQTNIETLYAMTSRLSQLSLAEVLR